MTPNHTADRPPNGRKVVVHVQTTLNGCIADATGGFWEPFP